MESTDVASPEFSSPSTTNMTEQAPTEDLVPQAHPMASTDSAGRESLPPHPLITVKQMPNLFGEIREQNVVFCVDTSGSMVYSLDAVKEHLVETLYDLARRPGTRFNVIEFSSEIVQWSDKMVECTPQTVAIAGDWIKKLEAKTGTNTLEALLVAFSDMECDAVCLVTDGLPDQNLTDILDAVGHACENRPVHAYYIQRGVPETSAAEFLQDLATETFGSFHVITVTQHGGIERITPVYRAEMPGGPVLRTTDRHIYPSGLKACSVSTTLNNPPGVVLPDYPPPILPHWPYRYPYVYPYSGRPWSYYYPVYYPNAGWSRYRPARAWMKQQPPGVLDYVPGAGGMLIDTKVLARRLEDGYYYLGKIKSQLLEDKFLVEFGPCKHGKYKDTSYQETYIYDIVSHVDALRHAVLTGDSVLAPWEPEGERYGPAKVIQGQEARSAEGGSEDSSLVVSFSSGKTATLPANTAVWIPAALHERVEYELKLPKGVRKDFTELESYPEENLQGYPTSGVSAVPAEYVHYEPRWAARTAAPTPPLRAYNSQSPYHVPLYPVYYKYDEPESGYVRNESDPDTVIPGTDMTKSELNEKVMSQLMQHKMLTSEKKNHPRQHHHQGTVPVDSIGDQRKLLKLRDSMAENSLRKSVSFPAKLDDGSDIEAEFDSGDLEMRDSGRGSMSDQEVHDDEKAETSETEGTLRPNQRSGSPLFARRRRRVRPINRPPWKNYWKQDPAPELLESNHYGPYRLGPYDSTTSQMYMEFLDRRRKRFTEDSEFGEESTEPTVRDSMGYYIPQPPPKPEKQGPGQDISEILGSHLTEAEKQQEMRKDFRRQMALQREQEWGERMDEAYRMHELMRDNHRQRVQDQLQRERDRTEGELDRVQQVREAKKNLNAELRARITENQERELTRDDLRMEALRARRERREAVLADRQRDIEETIARRQAIREQNGQVRWDAINERMQQAEAEKALRDQQHRDAKLRRIHHFREIEAREQELKKMTIEVRENKNAVFRSFLLL